MRQTEFRLKVEQSRVSYQDKKVQQYLSDWVEGKAVLTMGW